MALRVRKAQRQDFRLEFSDLPRRKVDDGRDLPADKLCDLVILGDLRARPLLADDGSEIDDELDRGLARLRIWFGRHDGACANIDGEELIEGDL